MQLNYSIDTIAKTIFNKACIEKKYTTMYAKLIYTLVKREAENIIGKEELKKLSKAEKNKEIKKMHKKTTLRRLIIQNIQDALSKLNQEFEVDKSDPDWEEKQAKHREKCLGNVRLLGCLFNEGFLSMDLLFKIIKGNLINYPEIIYMRNQVLTNVASDLLEGC
jgi:uncharacterized membrane protein YkoI